MGSVRRLLLVISGCAALAGCLAGASEATRAIVKTTNASGKPAAVGLIHPMVEPGAADGKGAWPNGRKFMASEIGSVAYVQVREQLERVSAPAWKDLSADTPGKPRRALLGASIHREYSLNGVIPVSRANELGRAADAPACLLISVIKFGPSTTKLELRSLGGLVKPAATTETATSWINCGIVAVVFRTPGGQVLWEAGYLASLPADTNTQEQAVARCAEELFKSWPWR